jgi:hypothetical protein
MFYNPFEIARKRQRAARIKKTLFVSVFFSSISAAVSYFFSKKENRDVAAKHATKLGKNIQEVTTTTGNTLYSQASKLAEEAKKLVEKLKDKSSDIAKKEIKLVKEELPEIKE